VLIAFVALVLHHYIQYSEFIEKEAPLIYAGATSVEIRSVGTFKISAAEKNWEENDLYGAGQWCKLFVEPHIIDENRCALQLRRRVNELIGQKFQEISTWALVRLIVQSHIKLTDGPLFPVLLLGLFCFAIFVAKYAVKYTQAIKNNFQISGLDSAPQTSASTSSVEQVYPGFHVVKMFLASCILFSHSYSVSRNHPLEPLNVLTSGVMHLGPLANSVFFGMSGFFAAKALISRPAKQIVHSTSFSNCLVRNTVQFLYSRIQAFTVPAFFFGVVCTGLFGPVFTEYDLLQYVKSRQTWKFFSVYAFPVVTRISQVGVFPWKTAPTLPAVLQSDCNELGHTNYECGIGQYGSEDFFVCFFYFALFVFFAWLIVFDHRSWRSSTEVQKKEALASSFQELVVLAVRFLALWLLVTFLLKVHGQVLLTMFAIGMGMHGFDLCFRSAVLLGLSSLALLPSLIFSFSTRDLQHDDEGDQGRVFVACTAIPLLVLALSLGQHSPVLSHMGAKLPRYMPACFFWWGLLVQRLVLAVMMRSSTLGSLVPRPGALGLNACVTTCDQVDLAKVTLETKYSPKPLALAMCSHLGGPVNFILSWPLAWVIGNTAGAISTYLLRTHGHQVMKASVILYLGFQSCNMIISGPSNSCLGDLGLPEIFDTCPSGDEE